MNIDEWAAEQCGIETIIDTDREVLWRKDLGKLPYPQFKIKDPRCREIVRERFGITTGKLVDDGWCCYWNDQYSNYKLHIFKGKTIAEAEIACITAIYEAQKDE